METKRTGLPCEEADARKRDGVVVGETETAVRKTPAERLYEKRLRAVERTLSRGDAARLVEGYLRFCEGENEEGDADSARRPRGGRRDGRRLPNPAGFCRFLGLSREAFSDLFRAFPREMGRVLAILEDEALNSDLSATTLGFYLRRLFGEEDERAEKGEGDVVVTFRHDIFSDGG